MSTDTPITAALDCPEPKYAQEIQFDGARYFAVSPEDYEQLYESHLKLERENARLREELAEARSAAEKWMSQCAEWRDANVKLGEDMAVAKREIEQRGELANRHAKAYADAQARALEYKTEHAALLGTSQWQEVEIADLRDDVKRHMKIASECEERALAVEKDADKQWYLGVRNALNRLVETPHEDWPEAIEKIRADNDARYGTIDAAMGAKHD